MSTTNIKITVSAPASAGKTTIAHLLQTVLKDFGFNVILSDKDPIPDQLTSRIQSLTEKDVRIEIETVQVSKSQIGIFDTTN